MHKNKHTANNANNASNRIPIATDHAKYTSVLQHVNLFKCFTYTFK